MRFHRQHIQMNGGDGGWEIKRKPRSYDAAPVAGLRDKAVVSKHAGHQPIPHRSYLPRTERRRRCGREAVAGQRRTDYIEGILDAAPEAFGMGKRFDDVVKLEDRPGPSVSHHQRQSPVAAPFLVNEVYPVSVYVGAVLREAVQLLLARAPVVVVEPVIDNLLHES